MGRLKIVKVIYIGDTYHFESPLLKDGVNIIEGENEHGKSTFMNLVYYGLGGKVYGFNKNDKNSKEKHPEICNDTNNYVELHIEIDDHQYELTRHIGDNHIYVLENSENIIHTKINRNSRDCEIVFSDWLLEKLNIKVFEMFQGTRSFKLNFNDLFRLVYHDQKTEIDKIYKYPDDESSYSDSVEIRKAIFEILMGQSYDTYYDLLGKYKEAKRAFDNVNTILQSYDDFLADFMDEELENVNAISNKLNETKSMYDKALISRDITKEERYTASDVLIEVEELKSNMRDHEAERNELLKSNTFLKQSIEKISFLIKEAEYELKEIERIRFINSKLKLFSPNTCPFCLTKVDRIEGHCICGNELNEDEYEKFFYTDDEYLVIMQAKKKSIMTLKDMLQKKFDRVEKNKRFINEVDGKIVEFTNQIDVLFKDINPDYNTGMIRKLDDRIFVLKNNMIELENALELAGKKEEKVKELGLKRSKMNTLKFQTDKALNTAKEDILSKREGFSKYYLKYMKIADSNCFDAYIGDDYMPIINTHEYRARSTRVPRRLMYFITLLVMSLKSEISYPKLLLIDTPNKEGIDDINLKKNIGVIDTIIEDIPSLAKYQVIMSTGINRYPNAMKERVFITLKDENKLLKKVY